MITRIINGIDIDIDESLPNELYFTRDFIDSIPNFCGTTDQIKDGIYNANDEYLPISIMWEITNSCNFSCPFCYINTSYAKRYPFYSLEEMQKIADTLINMGMLFCTLSGGECLLQPNFEDIYIYLKKKGVIVSVFSNGLLLNDKIIEIFKRYMPYKVEISIYGITDKSFKNATKTNYNYATVLENILKLKKIGVNIRCKTPITNLTSTDIPLIKKWCENNDVYYYVSDELYDSYYGENVDIYRTQDSIFRAAIDERNAYYAKQADHKFGRKTAWNCSAGKYSGVISGDRSFYPCMSSIGIRKYRYPLSVGIEEAISCFKKTLVAEKGQLLAFCHGCNSCNICEKCVISAIRDTQQQCSVYCKEMERFR